MHTLESLSKAHPYVNWHEPLMVDWEGDSVWACRICVANHGLTRQSLHQWENRQDAYVHIYSTHT